MISEDRAMDTRDPGVFYWWDSHRAECLPCSVCPERTLTMCSYIRDTECVTQREWVRRGLGIPGAVMTPGGGADTDTEGVVVFRSLSDSDSDKVEKEDIYIFYASYFLGNIIFLWKQYFLGSRKGRYFSRLNSISHSLK